MDWSILQGITQYLFTSEHIATILTIIISIVIYELLKKGAKKSVGYVTAKKSRAGVFILILAILILFLVIR